MVVELISVGTEILLGNIVNTNAAYLAEKCALLGCSLYHQTVVGDNEERMEEAIRQAIERADIVILTGGLGPTKDDLTKEVTAKVFGRELYEDAHTKERIQQPLLYESYTAARRYPDTAYPGRSLFGKDSPGKSAVKYCLRGCGSYGDQQACGNADPPFHEQLLQFPGECPRVLF